MRRVGVGVGAALVVLLGGASAATAESMTRSFGGVTATLHYEADDFPAANGAMVVEPPSLTVSRDGGQPQTFTASDLRFLGPNTMFNARTSLVVQHYAKLILPTGNVRTLISDCPPVTGYKTIYAQNIFVDRTSTQ